MKKKSFFVGAIVLSELFIGCLLTPGIARAVTLVGGPYNSVTTTWSSSGSPYLLQSDVTVPDGTTLYIEAGVSVAVAPEADQGDASLNPAIYVTGGKLVVAGRADKPVTISGTDVLIYGGSSGDGSADIHGLNVSGHTEMRFEKARGYIASSTFVGSYTAISALGSDLTIEDSRITDNDVGVYVETSQVFQVLNTDKWSSRFGTGGMGNAFALGDSITITPALKIKNSTLTRNTTVSVFNGDTFTGDVKGNWWGSQTGPKTSGVNRVGGNLAYDPWLMNEPVMATSTVVATKCCSSVLFIPGLEASRLYTGTNRLWEPNGNADVKKLYLDAKGSSTDRTIYSGGPIDKALGLSGIYGGFMNFLNGLVADGTIPAWRAFGYDWRKPVADVVLGNEKKATTSESLLTVVKQMASSSPTGKVTLVAHSNGGLVAKYLIKTLADVGLSNIVSDFISVAVPYLGTPKAIGALLHGDDEAMLGGLIGTQSNMRGLGRNMSSAYSLLPSLSYFTKVFSPTVVFASTNTPGLNTGQYPKEANSSQAQNAFITDTANARSEPAYGDTSKPIRGNPFLTGLGEVLHALLDPYEIPTAIAKWAIVGWNKDTTKSLSYETKNECKRILFSLSCASVLIHKEDKTKMGDGTVVAPSATWKDGTVASIDLTNAAEVEGKSFDHSNILESSTTQGVIKSIIKNEGGGGMDVLPNGVMLGEPDYSKDGSYIAISTHSPVELNVYDAQGRHTGPKPKPAELVSNDFVIGAYEEQIPGSSYSVYGGADGSNDTYINVPLGENYKVEINGLDFGFFNYEVEKFEGGKSVSKIAYETEPVSPVMVATTTVGSIIPAKIHVDIDGNGSSDYESKPGGTGWPGNATSSAAAEKAANKQMIEVMRKTRDTLSRDDDRRVVRRRFLSAVDRKKILELIETALKSLR